MSRLLAALGGFLMLAGLAAKLPALAAAYLANVAMLQVAAAPACDPAWYLCRRAPAGLWYPPQPLPANEPALRGALGTLRRAAELDPDNRRARLHIAELQFALEDRRAAALTLAEAGWPPGPEPDLDANTLTWPAGSPLLTVGRYEYYLVRAGQYAEAGRWPEAEALYRLALAYAGERAIGPDVRDYHLAAANRYAQAGADPEARLLAGKHFVLAGQGSEQQAVPVLAALLAEPSGLPPAQQAWAAFYVGRAHEALGQSAAALAAYRQGWETAPQVRQNGIHLARLLQTIDPAQAGPVLGALEAAGPAFPAGRLGLEVDYRFADPATLPSGWTFLGYDLDPESLEHGGPLEAWLWWRPPASYVSGALLMTPGGVALQPQTLTNLALNNAFEWGEAAADGLPLGWAWRVYSEEPDSLFVAPLLRGGRESRAAIAANTSGPSSGLLSLPLPVETHGWYLMAGWMRLQGAPNSNIGRNCFGPEFEAPGPYFAAWPVPEQPDGAWVHLADLAPAFPDGESHFCRLILINHESPGGVAAWDDLLFARILPPDREPAP